MIFRFCWYTLLIAAHTIQPANPAKIPGFANRLWDIAIANICHLRSSRHIFFGRRTQRLIRALSAAQVGDYHLARVLWLCDNRVVRRWLEVREGARREQM